MNILLLASIILTIAPGLGQGGGSSANSLTSNLASNKLEPCQVKRKPEAYKEFTKKHIVADAFKRKSKTEWTKYLNEKGLCGRTPVQSFIEVKDEKKVKRICKSGRRLKDKNLPGNLCISKKKFKMYNVESTNSCIVTHVTKVKQYVVVACDNVENVCLPVHFEKYNKQQPDNKTCQPSA